MESTSWLEEQRELEWHTDEEIRAVRTKLLEDLKKWTMGVAPSKLEEELMQGFAFNRMGKELFEMGETLVQKYPNPGESWWLAEIVYSKYGNYYMYMRQPAEALKWYFKAIEAGMPHLSILWRDIAGCYIELGDKENADLWVEKCMDKDKDDGRDGWLDWVQYANYYQATERPERALALCQSVLAHHQYCPQDISLVMANAYKDLGDMENVVASYEAHVDKWPKDEEGFAALGLAHYEYNKNMVKAEASFIYAIELVKDDENYKDWVVSMNYNLAVMHLNEGIWDKGFNYLEEYYKWKYPPQEAAVFSNLIGGLPDIDSKEMGHGILQAIFDFEKSSIRPGSVKQMEDTVSEKPADEVRDAAKREFDISKLTVLENTQAN